jgi:1-acyl-sn-glycerol-3-phosphate acyltransferase
MLDLERLQHIVLTRRPKGQLLVGRFGLELDYRFPRKTEIVIENPERIPASGGAFLAMNHTDRYNYWPLQFQMWKLGLPFTATWVKGKYYESRFVGAFMDSTNNIPLPSRGYVITTEFRKVTGRPPKDDEYRLLRDLVDEKRSPSEILDASRGSAVAEFLAPDGQLGSVERFLTSFDALFEAMLRRVIELNEMAIRELGLNVLVFPEGTRSLRLRKGLTGLAQITQYLGAAIVPIGCSGSDKVYPGNSPFAKGGRIVYRVGQPLAVDGPELGKERVPRDVLPFTKAASAKYGDRYQAITDTVMSKISELIDPEYRALAEDVPTKDPGVNRFL